jgi:DNA-binding NarL/FixJ family response regulator
MNKIRVLLVDNNKKFLSTAKNFLSSDPSIDVIDFSFSGEEGIEKVKLLNPDLVLMDLSMPGMGGLKATNFIKSLINPPKIIILTLYDTPEYRNEVKISGADGFVSKSEFGTELIPLIKKIFSYHNTDDSLISDFVR